MTPSAHRVPRQGARRAFAILARGLLFLLTLVSAAAAPVKFNIPAQPAPGALRAFIKQSGTQVLFNAGDLKGAKVNEVVGDIEPAVALEQLLVGTGLSAQRSGPTGFVVARTEKTASNPNAANEEAPAPNRRAQSKTDSDIARLQPMVVTARKRVERLQDVPASIAAATGHTLSDLDLTSITELDTIAPGLTFVTNPSRFGSGPSISLRGISTQTQSSGIQDSVGIVIDGVVVERAKAASFPDMSDTARVEILRGAQGTLFGKNASAGVISITTMDPSEAFDSRVTLNYATHDEKTMRAFVSGPIVDGLLLGRLSVYSKS